MTGARVRDTLSWLSARPPAEWPAQLEREFPGDAALRAQALLWLHAEREGPALGGVAPSLGSAADERYELALRLDTGATAAVWQAFDRRLGRNVAIKVFHDHGQSEALDQVLAEARAASDVVSEHVVRVLDVQYGEARPYIVMELVAEYDASGSQIVLGMAAAALQPQSIEEATRWATHVARGVHEAHQRNVFHRDLKPKNVLVTPRTRRAKVADFGLAVSGAASDLAHPAITLLKGGPSGPVRIQGTPEYMAPEQARGLPLTLDPRAVADRAILIGVDVWGVGAVAYDLLAGRPPWLGRPADDLSAWEVAASSESPPALARTRDGARVPARLRRVIERAMATDVRERYSSAAAVASDLQAFLDRRPTSLDRSRLLRALLWSRRNPQLALTALVAIALTALAAGTHATVTELRRERDALDRVVAAQTAEATRLAKGVAEARSALEETRGKLATERENLKNLEVSIGDERASYESLIEVKEQSLRDATAATRQIMTQLEAARRERQAADAASAKLERLLEDVRRDGDKAAQERDRVRREREAARAERDAVQRERDAAIAEREDVERQLRALEADLVRVRRTQMNRTRTRPSSIP